MIWERSKRKDTRLKTIDQRKIRHTPQASAGQLTPCVLPLRLSSKSFQVACSAPPLSTKVPRNRCCFLRASSQKVSPRRQMQDFERRRRWSVIGDNRNCTDSWADAHMQFHHLLVPVLSTAPFLQLRSLFISFRNPAYAGRLLPS